MLELKNHRIVVVAAGEVVTVSPELMSGAPVFTGTRVPVKHLFDYLAAGDSLDEFFTDFPNVARDQVTALLRGIGESFDGA